MRARRPSADTHMTREETIRIMEEMERLLSEMKETMGTMKKLVGIEPIGQGSEVRKKVRGL